MCGARSAEETNMNESATLRDSFAAAAMQGWMASWLAADPHPADFNLNVPLIAKRSYLMADAMLAEREKGLK
ncbi:MAG: hypothetical protein IPK44_25155 [Candidatus Accumulibacter sp.]|nr:hypothetical protein [Accumulibacter sp.]